LKGQDGDGHDQGRPQQDPGNGALIGEAGDPRREHRQIVLCSSAGSAGVQECRGRGKEEEVVEEDTRLCGDHSPPFATLMHSHKYSFA
jgi:hypothetical protein